MLIFKFSNWYFANFYEILQSEILPGNIREKKINKMINYVILNELAYQIIAILFSKMESYASSVVYTSSIHNWKRPAKIVIPVSLNFSNKILSNKFILIYWFFQHLYTYQ